MPDFRVFPQSELDNMHIANGMVRLDFKASAASDQKDLRLIMTPQGYLQTFEMFQRVLDKLCEQETDRLRTALAEARVIANNASQTTEIINAIRPSSVPAWIVSSPYTSIYPPATATASS